MLNQPDLFLIGAHTSTAGGIQNSLLEGKEIGASTVQLFTSNQRQWKSRELDTATIEKWQQILAETELQSLMSHDSYLINLGSPNLELLEKSRQAFLQELIRCQILNITYLNFHPGAAVGSTSEECLNRIVDNLLSLEPYFQNSSPTLLLETTAGQGSAVGYRFEQLHYLIDRVKQKIPIGVCIDTCHIFVAGYDIRTASAWENTLQEFDKQIGLHYLKAFHLNDSLKDLGSRVDRHAELGQGKIGWEAFEFLVKDERTRYLPMYLETPGGPENWKNEIFKLKNYFKEKP